MKQEEEESGQWTEVTGKIKKPPKMFLVPKDELSSAEKADMVYYRAIVAAVNGPGLYGSKNPGKWQFGTAEQFHARRNELIHLLDNLSSTERKKRTLAAIMERRSFKATDCKECKNVSVNQSSAEHVISDEHIENLASKNLYITCADFDVLKTVLQYAVPKERILTSVSPFLIEKISQRELLDKTYLGNFRNVLKNYKSVSFEKSMKWAWKLMFNEYKIIKCSSCDVLLESEYGFTVHVLSDEHINKIFDSNKYLYQRDIDFMHDLVYLSKNLHSRVDDAEPVLIDDHNVLELPFLKGRFPRDVALADRMSKDDMLKLASQAGCQVPLMITAKQLAIHGCKVRKIKCQNCSVYLAKKQSVFYHVMSKEHLLKVMEVGRVFSRSLDMDVFETIATKASQKNQERVAALGHI